MISNELRSMVKRHVKFMNAHKHDRLAVRQRTAIKIKQAAENGQIAIVYGGVDCDGGMWDNHVDLIPASYMALRKWEDHYYENAEGSQWADIHRPSDVLDLESDSRDLALEAFENGHSHVLHI